MQILRRSLHARNCICGGKTMLMTGMNSCMFRMGCSRLRCQMVIVPRKSIALRLIYIILGGWSIYSLVLESLWQEVCLILGLSISILILYFSDSQRPKTMIGLQFFP